MNTETTIAQLRAIGFIVGKRDPRISPEYPGAYMVTQTYSKHELPTTPGTGPWSVVGDDLAELIEEARAAFLDDKGNPFD